MSHETTIPTSSSDQPEPIMPLPIPEPPVFAAASNSSTFEPVPAPFPARTTKAFGTVGGIPTDVMCIHFADKIMITISQGGRLAQWVHVPLNQANPTYADSAYLGGSGSGYGAGTDYNGGDGGDADKPELLPLPHLTPTTILGGTIPEREITGQLYATQIASAIASRDPEEKRTVVLGLGLEKVEKDSDKARAAFFDVMELVLKCI